MRAHPDHRRERDDGQKVSASEFARQSATTNDRVMRYYRGWERAAEAGKVPHADDLDPGAEPDLDWARRLPDALRFLLAG